MRLSVLVDGVVHLVVVLKIACAARKHVHMHVRHRLPSLCSVLRLTTSAHHGIYSKQHTWIGYMRWTKLPSSKAPAWGKSALKDAHASIHRRTSDDADKCRLLDP